MANRRRLDPQVVHKLVEKYFGGIPAQPKPKAPNVDEPEQTKEKYLKVDDPHAQNAGILDGLESA